MKARFTTWLAFIAITASIQAHCKEAKDFDPAALSESRVDIAETTAPGQPGKSFVASTLIDAPVSGLCGILKNYAAYPQFMPNTAAAEVTQSGADFAVVDMTLSLPLGKTKKYRLRMESKESAQMCRLSWKQIPWKELKEEETIADTYGYWQLTPSAAYKNKTAIKYTVYTDPGPVPLGLGWIVDSLSKDSIPKTLNALRDRATRQTSK